MKKQPLVNLLCKDWGELWGRHLWCDWQYQALLWHMGRRCQYCKQVHTILILGANNAISESIIWYLIPDNISDTWCFTLLNFRMDSTGVEGRIQVNERTRDVLKQVSLTPPLSTVQLKIQSPKIPPSINVLQKCIVCNISVVWVWRAGRHLCEREGQHESVPLHKTEGECPQNVLKCFLLFQSPQFLASQG